VVLYEAVTGRPPFTRDNPAAAMHAILNQDPPPFPRDGPAEFLALEPLIRRCLAKQPEQRFPDAAGVAAALRTWARDGAVTGVAPAPRATRRRRVPLVALIAGMVAVAALAGWLVSRRSAPAGAAKPAPDRRTVAVLEFENLSGDASLDWMRRGVSELVASALIQTPALDVFDAQRLGDLAESGGGAGARAAPGYAFLARHGIRRAIVGSIMRSGRQLRLQGQLVDTEGGRVIRGYAVEGAADSGLFNLVGELIPVLQVALEVNLTGNREAEIWLREITTTSADAYRFYLRGHEALLASRWKEAASALEQALALDSTFVAARTDLSGAYWNLGDEKNLQLSRAAMQRLRERADHRERLRIDLLESIVGPGDPAMLVRTASELVRIYPENRFYTYLLGRGYFTTGDYRRCLQTLQPLVEQRFSWSWTYVLSARSAVHLGDTTAALRTYRLGWEVTQADPELTYVYARFLESIGRAGQVPPLVERALQSEKLPETPAGEGALRMLLAKSLQASGRADRAREEIRRADALVPASDEARPELDSLLTAWKTGG
jgi:TolB-like protein